MPNRDEVYAAINSERDYQDRKTADETRPDMVQNLSAGDHLLAMEHLLSMARKTWYSDAAPYPDTAEYIRKVAGLCVKWMETYSAPPRDS